MSMEPGFFTSKAFLVSAVVAALVLGGAAGAYALFDGPAFASQRACDAPTLRGASLASAPTIEEEGRTRTVTYALDASRFTHATLDACVGVGELLIEASNGTVLELVFTVEGDADALRGTVVEAAFRDDGGRLVVGAWESRIGESASVFGIDGASLTLVARVPADASYVVRASDDVGDVRIRGLRLDALEATTDVGNVVVTDVDLQGNATLRADVGDAILHALSVQSGELVVTSEVGNAEAQLPQRADVGYDARAAASVGEAVVRIGEAEAATDESDATGGAATARTNGYAAKPTKVIVRAQTDVGDARITAV